jgi:hypothetical protein
MTDPNGFGEVCPKGEKNWGAKGVWFPGKPPPKKLGEVDGCGFDELSGGGGGGGHDGLSELDEDDEDDELDEDDKNEKLGELGEPGNIGDCGGIDCPGFSELCGQQRSLPPSSFPSSLGRSVDGAGSLPSLDRKQ